MEGLSKELSRQIKDLQEARRGLTEIRRKVGGITLSGALPFTVHYNGHESITACFDVELCVPESYPDDLPIAWEIGGSIREYEHKNPDGSLCLCVPIKSRIVFHRKPTLLGFVELLLLPFLYGYCYWKKHGIHPFGEQRHGSAGIVQFYVDTFDLKCEKDAVEVIRFLSRYGYDGHRSCPCGGGRLVKRCHGKTLRELHHRHTPQTLREDLGHISWYCLGRR